MEKSNLDKYILQSVANTLDILDILCQHDNLNVQEISDLSGFGKSSVFRMLATLEAKGFIRKTDSARYSLDMKLAYLGNSVLERTDIVKHGHTYLEALTEASGETSHLGVLYKDAYVRFVDKVVSRSTIHMDSYLGFYRYAHLVSCGKAILAYRSEAELDRYIDAVSFEPLTSHSIKSSAELRKVLEQTREKGYALDLEESETGLVCIGAPIFNLSGHAIAAVSISGPSERMYASLEKGISLVVDAAGKITNSMR